MLGLVGRKIGMTQIVHANGDMIPVTVLEVAPSVVTRVLTAKDNGYEAVQLGTEDVKKERLSKAMQGVFAKQGVATKRVLKEFRPGPQEKIAEYKVGQEIGVDFFNEGDFVDIQGTTLGKGFAGPIKRWNMTRGPETHGSMYHRRPGSSGANTDPGRSWPGHKKAGRLGGETQTVQNLLVVRVVKEDNALLVRGAVPGHPNALITIHKSLKRTKMDLSKLRSKGAAAQKTVEKKAVKAPKNTKK